VAKELGKRKADYPSIQILHRLLYGRPGEAPKRKANLRLFNGLPVEAAAIESTKWAEKLGHHTVEELRLVCRLLNLEDKGEKKQLVERICKFLIAPSDLGESKSYSNKPLKRKRARTATPSKKSKGRSPSKTKAKAEQEGEGDDAVEESDEEADVSSEADGMDLDEDQISSEEITMKDE